MKKSTIPTGYSCSDYLKSECGIWLERLRWNQDLSDLNEYVRVSPEEDALLRDVFQYVHAIMMEEERGYKKHYPKEDGSDIYQLSYSDDSMARKLHALKKKDGQVNYKLCENSPVSMETMNDMANKLNSYRREQKHAFYMDQMRYSILSIIQNVDRMKAYLDPYDYQLLLPVMDKLKQRVLQDASLTPRERKEVGPLEEETGFFRTLYERERKRCNERIYAATSGFSWQDDDDTIRENMKRVCDAIAPYTYSLMIYSDVIALEFCLNRFDWCKRADLCIDDYLNIFKELRQEYQYLHFPLELILDDYINRQHASDGSENDRESSWKESIKELKARFEADYFKTCKEVYDEILHSGRIEEEERKQEEAKNRAKQERYDQFAAGAFPCPEDESMLSINQVETFIHTLEDKEYVKFGKHYYTKRSTVLQPYPEIQ